MNIFSTVKRDKENHFKPIQEVDEQSIDSEEKGFKTGKELDMNKQLNKEKEMISNE